MELIVLVEYNLQIVFDFGTERKMGKTVFDLGKVSLFYHVNIYKESFK